VLISLIWCFYLQEVLMGYSEWRVPKAKVIS
jgi:hypothetical protein